MKKCYVSICVVLTTLSAIAQSGRALNAFSKLSFTERPFTLTGTIKGYAAATDSFTQCNVEYNHLYKEEVVQIATIDKEGHFSLTMPLVRPQPIMLFIKETPYTVYAVPGTSLEVEIDLPLAIQYGKAPMEELCHAAYPVSFKGGAFARLNEELVNWNRTWRPQVSKDHGSMAKQPDQLLYKKFMLEEMARRLDTLTAFNRRNNTSTEFRQVATQSIRYGTAYELLRYSWPRIGNGTDRKAIQLTPEYLRFLEDIPLNNEEAVVTDEYNDFLDGYTNLYQPHNVTFQNISPDFLAFFRQLQLNGNDIDTNVVKFFEKPMEQMTPAQLQAAGELLNEYSDEMQDYFAPALLLQMLDSLQPHLPRGIGSDLIIAHQLTEAGTSMNARLTPGLMDSVLTRISHPLLRALLQKNQQELANTLSVDIAPTAHLRTPIEVTGDRFFQELIKPYKGKVVYIDFWAPWCGPCMADMPATKVLQQEMKDQDIVFLFIALKCTRSSWENTIKEKRIDGEHYLANDDEGALLASTFKISGIPHHVLVDKNGAVKDSNAPGVDEKEKLKKKLSNLLK